MMALFRQTVPLKALPGVGRKTANVVLNEAFGQPTIAVDTYFPARQPHQNGTGKTPDGSKLNYCAGCQTNGKKGASLADFAWSLCIKPVNQIAPLASFVICVCFAINRVLVCLSP